MHDGEETLQWEYERRWACTCEILGLIEREEECASKWRERAQVKFSRSNEHAKLALVNKKDNRCQQC